MATEFCGIVVSITKFSCFEKFKPCADHKRGQYLWQDFM